MKRAVIVVLGVCLIVGSHLRAQSSYEPVHTFSGNQGRPVAGLVQDSQGRLYGTTEAGGQHGKGSVFATDVTGLDAAVLHEFDGSDGEAPVGRLLLASDGNFYGTTSAGGPGLFGTVFRMTPEGDLTTVLAFDDLNGGSPLSGLIEVNGVLYGTTVNGGAGFGTVFSLTFEGVHTVIPFDGSIGASPSGRLMHRVSDNSIYGTAQGGGANGAGAIFRLTPEGALETFASFDAAVNGSAPNQGIVEGSDGNFYGTTPGDGSAEFGSLFRMTPAGDLSTVVAFTGENGAVPSAGLGAFGDAIYGTTRDGGAVGLGTVFRLSIGADASEADAFQTLISFSLFDGAAPRGGLLQGMDGSIFGVTSAGGAGGLGTVFQLTPDGGLSTTLAFTGSAGATPAGRLLQASDGNFYGMTLGGGAAGMGTIFKMTPDGLMSTLVSFDGSNGEVPSGGLMQASNGDLYGTTEAGGIGEGTVFRINLTTGELTTIAEFDSFASTGARPRGGLVEANGSLWGTTEFGPTIIGEEDLTFTDGSVFRMTLDGALTTVATFTGGNGAFPTSGLSAESNGYLYGVTESGGDASGGTVFRISTLNDDFSTIKHFDGAAEGFIPAAAPLLASNGSLYGTTQFGGASDMGVVYRIDLNAGDAFEVVASFDGANGFMPYQEGLVEAGGELYGTASNGGDAGFGTVYHLDGGAIVPIHSFDGIVGANPSSTLIRALDGALYGTTMGPLGGTIFRVTFEDEGGATLEVAPASATYGGVTTLSATLSSSAGPSAGVEIAFTLNGVPVGSAVTNGSGVAELAGVSVAGLDAGSYAGAIHASAAAANVDASGDLTINRAIPTVTVAGGTFAYDTHPHAASASVTGVNGEDLGAAGILYNGSASAPVDPGTYAVTASFAGNTNYEEASASATLTILPPAPGVAGLIAAFGFNENSGNVAGDASGLKHFGVISGAKHVDAGRFGRALQFDGKSDWVTIADHTDLDLRYAMTIEAWVNPAKLSGWNTIALKETKDSLAYSLYANDDAPRAAGYVNIGGSHKSVASATSLPLNTWTHVAVTYNGSMMRLYINGAEVRSKSVTGRIVSGGGPLRIGGNAVWGEYFNGLIDEVRVYGSALSPAEILRDMHMPIAHEFEPPVVSIVSPLDGAVLSGRPMITVAASDNVAVSSVQLRVDGDAVQGSLGEAPYTTRLELANGLHTIRAVARDTAGNQSVSAPITIRIANRRVADYGFNETSGSSVVDQSGLGNNGTMNSGVTRAIDAQRGTVAQFNGSSGRVSVADADSLDLKAGMTLEAWVKPTSLSGWRTVVLKEGPDTLAYALYANDSAPWPAGYVRINGSDRSVQGSKSLPLNAWTHLAMTYDGETMRLFVNGEEKESRSQTGNALVTSGRLSIGGNTVWGEYFRGQMDDVRIYDVAVSEAQIKADMNGVLP